ncbi:MAG: prophage PssSM-03 [Pseudomonas orientalis]|nr:prophage PssSM-03 [Pseudomonas orientalis]
MKKSHGPAFRAAQLDLAKCPACHGRAVIKGVFHELACVRCNASGWLTAENGEALPLEVLVTQLSIRLQAAEHQIAQFNCFKPAGAEAQYNENNRRGAGGTNFTGD